MFAGLGRSSPATVSYSRQQLEYNTSMEVIARSIPNDSNRDREEQLI
jgi:hypothetical protein